MTRRSSILDDALRLHALPVSVIPIACNKKPPARFSWKRFQSERAEESRLRDWFSGRDDLGVGIVLGPVSGGLYARDFDQMDAYKGWADSHKALARSLPTVTTSRGRHVYARYDAAHSNAFNDGELRAAGMYVVAPHSRHPSGGTYCWSVPISSLTSVPVIDPAEAGFVLQRSNATDRTDKPILSDLSDLSLSVAGILQGTIPAGFGTRRGRLFELARRIRGHAEWSRTDLAELRPILQEWHRLALPFIRTREFDVTWLDFTEAYDNVNPDRCGDAAAIAMRQAESNPLPPIAMQYGSEIVRRLVALCFQLSLASADGVFFLSCRKAAAVLGTVDHQSVARWLKLLCADRVIAEVEKGGPHNNRATRYRWTGRIK